MVLYPLKFKPIYQERVWGGNKLSTVLKRVKKSRKPVGESWELSPLSDSLSVVAGGFLKGNNIEELIEIYMGDLVGEKVYETFGVEFPLLVKLIDSAEQLSVQVHPDDKTALDRHKAYGKTEMWYVIDASEDSRIYVGFNKDLSVEEYWDRVRNGNFPDVMNVEKVKKGDVFFLPAGRVHAIGKNLLIAEIQQPSDITYRIYDWGRETQRETAREMHYDLAADIIDYKCRMPYGTQYDAAENSATELVTCKYFTTNLLSFSEKTDRDYAALDSFVVYMCMEGQAKIVCDDEAAETVSAGETVLIPAIFNSVSIVPEQSVKLLEVYVP
ncbi:MAG: class I mannose-6-phosphate isomerase [Prevotellaceae bacterium]|jgi:mannose-6-phosphate isomerase|nr:class I mannose-6-phosphate isomerase [Prevotellaceae bacterium]